MSKRPKVPGTLDFERMAKGAVPLGPPPVPRTIKEVTFQGVGVDWVRILAEDNTTVLGYQMVITDQADNKTYRLPFNEKNRMDMIEVLAELGNEVKQ